MFCEICENFMDITNNISNEIADINKDDNDKKQLEIKDDSSDYDVTDSMQGGSSTISETNVQDILNGHDIDFDTKNFNLDIFKNNQHFKKLTNNQKTLVINRILEKIPKPSKLNKSNESVVNKDSYFYCKSCGYNKKIPEKMFIFSRGDEKKDDLYNNRFINNKNDNTLPFSKKYNCINDNCLTHKNPEKKMAVFYRQKSSYNIRYICTICDSYWNTFVEK